MKKVVFVLFFVLFNFNTSFAIDYSQDNAVYWYDKGFGNLKSAFKKEELADLRKIRKYEDFKNIKPGLKEKFTPLIKQLLGDLKKAREQKIFKFWDKIPENDRELEQYNDNLNNFVIGSTIANILAYHAISLNKPEVAGAIWLSILKVTENIIANINGNIRGSLGYRSIDTVLDSLEEYFKQGAPDKFKRAFVSYLKQWPKQIFDLKDAIKTNYEYAKKNLPFYENNQKELAHFFEVYTQVKENDESKDIIIENKECDSKLKTIEFALKRYQRAEKCGSLGKKGGSISNSSSFNADSFYEDFDSDDLSNNIARTDKEESDTFNSSNKVNFKDLIDMKFDDMISFLIENGFLKGSNKDYQCNLKGSRKITQEAGNYKVICDCGRIYVEGSSDFMTAAQKYKERFFEKHKKELFEYYDFMMKFDHSQKLFLEQENQLTPALSSKYKGNLLAEIFGIFYSSLKFEMNHCQERIENFIKTYDK